MKKFLTIAFAIALAFTAVASTPTAGAQSMSMAYAFNSSLTIGSTGSDVVALQSFLISKGLLTMPAGVAEGYFGSLTRSAVSAYQVMKGITPTAGYFGPITRAAVMADMSAMGGVTTTPVCPVGFSCTPTTTTPVCPVGYTCTSNPGTTTTNNGTTEGTLNINLASTPASNASIRQQTDVPVYGIQFQAQIADVTVQTVDLQVGVYNSGTSSFENPATLINTMKVWDGSNVIATVPVSLTTFTRDQNQVYHYRFSNLNFVVPAGQTKNLTFTFTTNSIDNSRQATIQGYSSSSIRATSGANISSFYDISSSAYALQQTFLKPGNSVLTLSAASSPLRSQNYRVNPLGDSLQGVPLLSFNLKSDSGDSSLLTVTASTTASGTKPTTLYLYQGSTLLQSKSVDASGSVIFNNLNNAAGAVISQNSIQTYTIKADFPSSTTNGTSASTTVTSVVYQTPNGSTGTLTSPTVAGVNQYVWTAAPLFTLASTPTIMVSGSNQFGSSTALTASFNFNVTAQGGTMTQPDVTGSDFVVVFTDGTHFATSTSKSVVTIPNNNIADGSTASVTVTAQAIPSASGLYNAYIASIHWTVGSNTVTQTYGLDDFKTSSAANFIK